MVSLDWLTDVPATYPAAPGVWWQDAEAAYVDPQGAELSYQGEPITGVQRFELVNSGAGTRVSAGDVEVEVARRSGYLIRVHSPKAPAIRDFRGVPTYQPDPNWVITGTFEPLAEPRPTTVGAASRPA